MRSFLHKLPVPAGCVALGMIGLGTLLSSIHPLFQIGFGVLSVLFQIGVLLKLCLTDERKAIFRDFVSLSTLSGTSMAMMLTAAQLKKQFSFSPASVIWYAALFFHLFILLFFSRKLLRERPAMSAVRGSWLLVYVGIAAAAISAPAFSANRIGLILLVPAALGAVVLVPLVYRADLLPDNIPAGQKPLFCISAAPCSIWLAGYLSSSSAPSRLSVLLVLVAAQLLYIPALIRCIKTVRQSFSPAFASFTFPFVISASALKQSSALLGLPAPIQIVTVMETLIAVVLCLYTLWLYLRFLFRS